MNGFDISGWGEARAPYGVLIRVRCRVYNLGGGYLYYFGSILSPEDTVIDS